MLACYCRALELKPDSAKGHSNLVYTQVFCSGYDAQALYKEHRRWNQKHAEPFMESINPISTTARPPSLTGWLRLAELSQPSCGTILAAAVRIA